MSTVRMPRLAVAALSGLLALASLSGCGGSEPAATAPDPVATAALVAARPGDLLAYARARLGRNPGSGLPSGVYADQGGRLATAELRASSGTPGTLVQEAGVDEPDLLKLGDGHVLTLHGARLRLHRLAGDGLTALDERVFNPAEGVSVEERSLHLSADGRRAALLQKDWEIAPWAGPCLAEVCAAMASIAYVPTVAHVELQLLDIGTHLTASTRWRWDGVLVGSRRVGSQLVLVSTHTPALTLSALPSSATTAERDAMLAALKVDDLLPRLWRANAAPQPLVAETDCLLQPANTSTAVQITTVTVIDLAAADPTPRSRCFVGGTEAMYMSADTLVLATTRSSYDASQRQPLYAADMQTDIHRFDIAGSTLQYRASGSVPGHLGWDPTRKSQRLSQWQDQLRVLTFTGREGWGELPGASSPSPATLSVLREQAGALQVVGQLPNARRPAAIGKADEQIYAVHFAGAVATVVTFRRTDPLYVLDLSDPADPHTAGELELSGFSQDLFDVGPGWLLGAGRDADETGRINALAFTLFDLRDPAQPRVRARARLGHAGSTMALDSTPLGLNLLRQGSRTRAAVAVALATADAPASGLQRLSIDTDAATLTLAPLIAATDPAPGKLGVDNERALVLEDRLLYLDGNGALTLHAW